MNLAELIAELQASGALPEDVDPIEVLASLITNGGEGQRWQGFPYAIGEDVPIVEIDSIVENLILPKMKEQLEASGHLVPVGFVFARHAPSGPHKRAPEGQARHLILGVDGPFDPDVKEKFSQALKLLAWKTDAVAVLFASEAWTVLSTTKEELDEYRNSLEDHPERREIVIVHFEREHGRSTYYHAPIHRDEDGKPTLGQWEVQPQEMSHSGRFTHFLLQNSVGL